MFGAQLQLTEDVIKLDLLLIFMLNAIGREVSSLDFFYRLLLLLFFSCSVHNCGCALNGLITLL